MSSWLEARGGYREPPSRHMTAQVCVNGHPTTDSLENSPELAAKFCASCGAATIRACPNCNAPIRGYYYVPGVISLRTYEPPRYCHNCGKSFPWTAQAIKTAEELTDEIEALDANEKAALKSAITDLTTDTPKTELASVRYRKLLAKAGTPIANAMGKIIISVVTEAAKKAIGL